MSGDRGLLEIDVIKARRQLRQVRDAGRLRRDLTPSLGAGHESSALGAG
jgi:hypothetical protein